MLCWNSYLFMLRKVFKRKKYENKNLVEIKRVSTYWSISFDSKTPKTPYTYDSCSLSINIQKQVPGAPCDNKSLKFRYHHKIMKKDKIFINWIQRHNL